VIPLPPTDSNVEGHFRCFIALYEHRTPYKVTIGTKGDQCDCKGVDGKSLLGAILTRSDVCWVAPEGIEKQLFAEFPGVQNDPRNQNWVPVSQSQSRGNLVPIQAHIVPQGENIPIHSCAPETYKCFHRYE
jgi:hypothetical protein